MMGIQTQGSGDSFPVNLGNFREVLSDPKSTPAQIARVAQQVLSNPAFRENIETRGLTKFQKEVLKKAIEAAPKVGLGVPGAPSYPTVRKMVLSAKDPQKLLQKEKADLAKKLTGEADAIYNKLREVHRSLANEITRMQQVAKKKGVVLDVKTMIAGLADLELQVKGWKKDGELRAVFMGALDQENNAVAGTIFNSLQKSLTSALQAVSPSFSEGLESEVAPLKRGDQEMVQQALESLDRSFSRAEKICETASHSNQKIANAESPQVFLQRLQKEKAALTTEVTGLVDVIHARYQELHDRIQSVVDNPNKFGLDKDDPLTNEMLNRYGFALRLVKSQVEKWGEGGENRQFAMGALDEEYSGVERVMLLSSEFQISWAEGVEMMSQDPLKNETVMRIKNPIAKFVLELGHREFSVLGEQTKKAMELNQSINAVRRGSTNQKIANAESPETALKRLKNEKEDLKKEVTTLVDIIHARYQELHDKIQYVVDNPHKFGLDNDDPVANEILERYGSALRSVKSQVEKWGKEGQNREVAMSALDLENDSQLQRVLSLSSEFYNEWEYAKLAPYVFMQGPNENTALESIIGANNRFVHELRTYP